MSNYEDLRKRYENIVAQFDVPQTPEYDPTEGMSTMDKLGAGVVGGVVRGGRGFTNLALPKSLQPKWATDEAIAEHERLMRPLDETGAGMTGQIIGEVASTLPLGAGVGSAARGLQIAGKALPRAVGYATSLPARATVEGAISSAALSSPENRGEAGLVGGAAGLGLGAAGKVLGRVGRGIAQESGDTRNLRVLAGQHGEEPFVPVAQAIGDDAGFLSRIVKSFYKEAAPYTPGVTGQFESQSRRLGDVFRRTAIKEADHFGVVPPKLLDNPQEAIRHLKKAIDSTYDRTIKLVDFNLPKAADRTQAIRAVVKKSMPEIDATTLDKVVDIMEGNFKRFAKPKGRTITGTNMLNAYNEVGDAIGVLRRTEREALIQARKYFDELIQPQMKSIDPALYDDYRKAVDAYSDYNALRKAVSRADESKGKFTPRDLLMASGLAPNQKQVARGFHEVTRTKIGMPGAAGRQATSILSGAALAGVGAAVGGPLGAIAAPSALIGAINLAARPGMQNTILGNTATQKWMRDLAARYPDALRMAGSAGRAGVTTQAGD